MVTNPTFANPGKTVVKPIRLAHVVLRTQAEKFKEMVEYYKVFLSMHEVHGNEFMWFGTYDEEHHRIAIIAIPNTKPRDPDASGLLHIAFTFGSLQDLALAYLQRKENGILPYWCVNHGPTTSMYYKDPDGNDIETQVENFDTLDECSKFMEGDLFKMNPIGTDFQPEELIKRLESGEDERKIKERAEIGARLSVPGVEMV